MVIEGRWSQDQGPEQNPAYRPSAHFMPIADLVGARIQARPHDFWPFVAGPAEGKKTSPKTKISTLTLQAVVGINAVQ